jgi:hypothetical protein
MTLVNKEGKPLKLTVVTSDRVDKFTVHTIEQLKSIAESYGSPFGATELEFDSTCDEVEWIIPIPFKSAGGGRRVSIRNRGKLNRVRSITFTDYPQ